MLSEQTCFSLRRPLTPLPREVQAAGGLIAMVRAPSVLRLITNSNLGGCMTGRSAGFSPFENAADINASLATHSLRCLDP
jgi:hypothetical protein